MKSTGRDVDLSWVDADRVKMSTFVTNEEVPTSLECMPIMASASDLYETRKKLSIKFEAKIQHPEVSISDEKILEAPCMSITEALMTATTHFPREKTGLHLGNIWQYNKNNKSASVSSAEDIIGDLRANNEK